MTPASQKRVKAIVDKLLRSESFSYWVSEEVDSGSYSRNSDKRDRYSRCYDAAENGADGSTHQECINDMRAFWNHVVRSRRSNGTIDRLDEAVIKHFDDLESWHEANGSLYDEVG